MSRVMDYPEDCQRIKEIASQAGFNITLNVASEIWENYSEHLAAGWLILPEEDYLIESVIKMHFYCNEKKTCPNCGQELD